MNKDSFTFFFSMSYPFISLLILSYCATQRFQYMMLKRRDERGLSCFIPNLSGEVSGFSLVSIILGEGFHFFFLIDNLYQIEDVSLYNR